MYRKSCFIAYCAIIELMKKQKNFLVRLGDLFFDWVERVVEWWCKLLHLHRFTKNLQQLTKFVIVGFINTGINWVVYFVCYHTIGLAVPIASAIAFAISTIFNFWASTTWVFDTTSRKTKRRLIIEFTIMNGIAFLAFDEALLSYLTYRLLWNPMLAKILTTAIGMVFNFITRKFFLEDHGKNHQPSPTKTTQKPIKASHK